jgi:hypothetical protein
MELYEHLSLRKPSPGLRGDVVYNTAFTATQVNHLLLGSTRKSIKAARFKNVRQHLIGDAGNLDPGIPPLIESP